MNILLRKSDNLPDAHSILNPLESNTWKPRVRLLLFLIGSRLRQEGKIQAFSQVA